MRQQDQLDAALKRLGGRSVLGSKPQGLIEVHLMLAEGLPVEALVHLLGGLLVIAPSDVLDTVITISSVGIRRRRMERRRLTVGQSASVWRFATILAQASRVFGDQERAARWLLRTAVELDQHCPIDLLATDTGAEVVAQFLVRVDFGVYT